MKNNNLLQPSKIQNTQELKTYLAFNKPKNCVCALKDNLHKTIMDFLPEKYQNLKIVGRLDKDTTGLILLTDDGDFLHKITHPKKHVSKTYQVSLKQKFQPENKVFLEKPFYIDYGKTLIKGGVVNVIDLYTIELTISEGKFHQVKKMMFNIDNEVVELQRIAIGNLKLKDLKIEEGQWKEISKNCI